MRTSTPAVQDRDLVPRVPNILSIAGSDPSGGAGIQADIKSIAASGGFALTAVTALTAQNTLGVTGVHTPPPAFLRQQLDAVGCDIRIDAVKIGMLGSAAIARTVIEWLDAEPQGTVVLDPVMVATSGARLLDEEARHAVLDLARRCSLVTPNIPELAVLVGAPPARSWSEALAQGALLATRLGTLVLVKGGHLTGERCPDALVPPAGPDDVVVFDGVRVDTRNSHGTGCSLSSAIATRYAVTGSWTRAVSEAKSWLEGALRTSGVLAVGAGSGPVNHFHAMSAPPSPERFTDRAWRESGGIRAEILGLPFVVALQEGTLPAADFAYYLHQDALYLREYSAVLALAAAAAGSEEEQLFWLSAATTCLSTEAELHRTWSARQTGGTQDDVGVGPVTRAYCYHLRATAAGGSYGELVAAVLPCFWLYAAVGEHILAATAGAGPEGGGPAGPDHPYAAWIDTYADPDFAAATTRARDLADRAYRTASATEREAMLQAFHWSSRYERDFFDAPRIHGRQGALTARPDLREDAVLT